MQSQPRKHPTRLAHPPSAHSTTFAIVDFIGHEARTRPLGPDIWDYLVGASSCASLPSEPLDCRVNHPQTPVQSPSKALHWESHKQAGETVARMGAAQDGGGTLHCPSPTHIHHVDPASALRQLRRSLSRSPSKGPTFRLVTSKSTSPSPGSPLSPSPLAPHARLSFGPTSPFSNNNSPLPSPLAIPFPPTTKKYRIGARRVSPTQAEAPSYHPLRSPIKRGLSDSTDLGNSSQSSSNCSAGGLENRRPRSPSPAFKSSHGCTSAQASIDKPTESSESLLAPYHAIARLERSGSYFADHPAKSSPLKRSDGTMDLDPTGLGSPSAKRRSLHGASFGADFDIFDQALQSFGSATTDHSRSNDKSMSDGLAPMDTSHIFSPQRRKSSSLRRTTLQQRHEKPNFARAKPNTDLAQEFNTPLHVGSKGRPRISLDNFLPPAPRDSPFSAQGTLPNASIHPVTQRKDLNVGPAVQNQPNRHPLSRTVTQSSSASSLAEDSPTHFPVHQPESRRPLLDFSKSLPYGVIGAASQEQAMGDAPTQTSSTEASFSTPESYKLARPLPAAFMSTGLISKRHKNPDMSPENVLGVSAFMPDTPCKRPTSIVEAVPRPTPGAPAGKSRNNRHSMHNFGTPSTPFNPHVGKPARSSFVRGVNIFGSSFNKANRRGSFMSVEGDDVSPSHSQAGDSQSSVEFNPSSTPSKLVMRGTPTRKGLEVQSPENPGCVMASSTEPILPSRYCKSTLQSSPRGSVNGDGDSYVEDSPSTALRFKSFSAISSFSTRSRLLRRSFRSPTPLSKASLSLPHFLIKAMETKSSPLSPASPTSSRHDGMSPRAPHTPHTPHQEGVFPPDPSGLSISAQGDGQANTSFGSNSINYLTFPPSTPTASKDYFSQLGKSRSTMTPTHSSHAAEFDPVLSARFGKVEVVGTGEFSQVYRASTKLTEGDRSPLAMSGPCENSRSGQAWAIKKSRNTYIGPRDRAQKLKEVEVLRRLGQSNHTIQLFDSWEHRRHLYIQTEYCEEGGLDLFLARVGRKARLDDFRIWKIALELTLVSIFFPCYTASMD